MNRKLLILPMALGMSAQLSAFELESGDDWYIRWDNTLKYNLMVRAAEQDPAVYDHPGLRLLTADPDLSFDRGDINSNRLDLFSEIDVVYKNNFGFRISGAAWYDQAYASKMDQPTNAEFAAQWANPSVKVGELSDEASHLHYRGAELLDAFAFGSFNVGDASIGLRAGRHSLYWGQSLLLTGAVHSVGGAMNTIDAIKGFSVPGSEAKELFMPTAKISGDLQLTDNLSLSAYYGFEFEPYRIPEATTYFSPADGLTEDAEMVHVAVAPMVVDGNIVGYTGVGLAMQDDETRDDGEWGAKLDYFFEDNGLEISAYYLSYHSKIPDGLVGTFDFTQSLAAGLFAGTPLNALAPIFGSPPTLVGSGLGSDGLAWAQVSIGDSKWLYKENVDLFGLSLSKEIAGISFGADLTYRHDAPIRLDLGSTLQRWGNYPDTPLAGPLAPIAGALGVPVGTPFSAVLNGVLGPEYDFDGANSDNYSGITTGDTWHLVINALGLLNDNGLWEGGSYIIETTFSMLDKFTAFPDYAMNGAVKVREGKVASHIGLVFKPSWYQVLPGVDMTLNTSVGWGLKGSSPIGLGGDTGVGTGGVGLDFNLYEKWAASVRYNFFFGPVNNGIGALWKDRDNLAFTLKRTF